MIAITPTRRPLHGRLRAMANCAYLRWVIRCAEQDLARHQAEFKHASEHLPKQIALDKQHIDSLTRRLIQEDRNT